MMHNGSLRESVNMPTQSLDLATARSHNAQSYKKPTQTTQASVAMVTSSARAAELNGSLPDLHGSSSVRRASWNNANAANTTGATASNAGTSVGSFGATYGSLLYPKYEFDPWSKSRLISRYKTLGSGLNQHSTAVGNSVNLPKIRVKRKILAQTNGIGSGSGVGAGASAGISSSTTGGGSSNHHSIEETYHQNVHAAFSTQTMSQVAPAVSTSVKKTRILPHSDRGQKPIYNVMNAAAGFGNNTTGNANTIASASHNATAANGNVSNHKMVIEEISPLPEHRSQLNGENEAPLASEKPPAFPLSPAAAIAAFGGRLTNLEKEEIHNHKQIWFLGTDSAKKIEASKSKPSNYGYDDDHGYYIVVIHDHIAYRYEVLEILGRGSFGQVVKAIDHQTGKLVAVKLIRNRKRLHQQAQVEISILNNMKAKDATGSNGFVIIQDSFQFRSHYCIVFELLSSNLYELMRHNHFQGFNINLIREIAVAILQCMRFLYKEKIIHCDLKPENIMFCTNGNSLVKVIDFGSSCYESQRVYTYIQSRFYRSPEVILGLPYTTGIDMWSFGCIMGELYTGSPLLCGENESEQLAIIMEIFGKPPKSMLEQASRKHLFFDSKGEAKYIMDSYGHLRIPNSRSLNSAIATSDYSFLDFVSKCLTLDPTQRFTPEEAFHHPWIQQLFQNGKHTRRLKRERLRTNAPAINSLSSDQPNDKQDKETEKDKEKENANPKEEKNDKADKPDKSEKT